MVKWNSITATHYDENQSEIDSTVMAAMATTTTTTTKKNDSKIDFQFYTYFFLFRWNILGCIVVKKENMFSKQVIEIQFLFYSHGASKMMYSIFQKSHIFRQILT